MPTAPTHWRTGVTRYSAVLVVLPLLLLAFALGFLAGRSPGTATTPPPTPPLVKHPAEVTTVGRTERKPSVPKAPPLTALEQTELLSLRKQVTTLRNCVAADAVFRQEIIDRGGASLLGWGIGEDFLVPDDFATFLQLSEEQKERLKRTATRLLDGVKSWEESHAVIVEEEAGKLLSYKLPPADTALSGILDEYRNSMKEIVGNRDFDMIASQVSSLVDEYRKERTITYYTVPNDDGGSAYQFSVEWSDGQMGSSGGSDEVGATLSEIPARWKHLFRMTPE